MERKRQMTHKPNIVHVTHEAVGKIGGIGAVLEGMLTNKVYLDSTGRSILVSPLFSVDGPVENRLGHGGEVLYSGVDGYTKTGYAETFEAIEKYFNVDIVYGRKHFQDERFGITSYPEIILIDVRQINPNPINDFKRKMFEHFGISGIRYERMWEFEEWVRLAPPAIAALKAIGAAAHDGSTTIVAHEFMGMPTALAGMVDDEFDFRTVFYAHETATVRRIVEERPGHDTMFYNVMNRAKAEGLSLSDVFGDQSDYSKHALVSASKHCDTVFVVGDLVGDELKFISSDFDAEHIKLAYNGIPAYHIDLDEKKRSRSRLQQYCKTLLGYSPDYIFTHVTRLVRSKGLWRDLRVLEHLEKEFVAQNKTGVLFVLSTEVGQRREKDILRMEADYHWPVVHHEGWPDLSGGELIFDNAVQEFNARSRNIKIVFINQFGFDRAHCGSRMPEDMEFMDIRKGSDVEFGQSIYEPFGIAQFEPLSFGGICVVSSVCGCAGFINRICNPSESRNVIIADYTDLDGMQFNSVWDLLKIDIETRNKLERYVSEKIAMGIMVRLPKNDEEMTEMINSGFTLAAQMSWDVVVEKYILPGLTQTVAQMQTTATA
jgi:glycosyltransferase involved in cell wall biosynthesis